MNVGPLDLLVLGAYLVATAAFGAWIGKGQRSASQFMLGDRALPAWLVLASIVATETSTVTFLSIPGAAWAGNCTWLQLPVGYAVGRVVVILVLMPRYFRGEVVTAYQVLHERFGGATKLVASLLFLVTRTLADGLRLFLSAIVLQEIAQIPMAWAIVALGVITIVYTWVGGLTAVVWTDFVQFVVYLGGAVLALWILLGRIDGGLAGLLDAAGPAGKLVAFDFGFDLDKPYQFWSGLIGGAVLSVATHGVDQIMVQRYLGAKNRAHASWALGLSGIVVFAQFALFLFIGVALWKFYEHSGRTFTKGDRVFASFIVEELPTPALGIVLGAVFSAAMSTLSSSLNSLSTAFANDFWFPRVRPQAAPRERLRTVRSLVIVFGALQIGVGIAGQDLPSSVVDSVLSIAGFTTGIVLGVFLLGTATTRVGQTAALCGLLCGAIVVSYVAFATKLAWPWYALVGSSTTFAAGLLVSYVLPVPRAGAHVA